MPLPTVFDTCVPKPEVLAVELPDAIFAADLWAVVTGNAHQDYLDPNRFFAGTYPTDNLKVPTRPLAFFAGIWTRWTSVRKVKDGETTNDIFASLEYRPVYC